MERTGIAAVIPSGARDLLYRPGPSTGYRNRRRRSLAPLGMTAAPLDRFPGPSRRPRAVGARLCQPRGARVEAPDVPAGLLHVLLVPEPAIGLHQTNQRVGCHRAPRVGGDQVLEIQDR